MVNQFEQTKVLISEMKTLFELKEKKFWDELFSEVKRKHTVQSDFCLVRKDIKAEDVEEYFMDVTSRLCEKYDLSSRESFMNNFYHAKYYHISFELDENLIFYEFSTCVTPDTIKLDLLPMKLNVMTLPLEDYVLGGNILSEICNLLFSPEEKRINRLMEEWNKIMSLSENLTIKTIEIAQNSIRTIYESSRETSLHIVQKNLFTDLEINKRITRIYHKDFLENPRVLTDLLKTKR
ncbi:MAG: hypothetical protein J5857_00785 [Treponema sp.]|nr:hypothetical protein [Treponema sp.]